MPSIQKIIVSLAFAASVVAQTQIADGQVQQVTNAPAVKQITDGQVQAISATPVKQITDGQIQAVTSVPTVAPVKQITDGQIQAVTSVAKATVTPVKQITDGQIQVVSTVATVASTGKVAPSANGTFASPAPSAKPFTGAASLLGWSSELAVAAIGAAAGFAML